MKKVLVVFLAVAMLFAFSAAALAAPSDLVGEPTDVQDAFNKFIAYGFIEGYEDGTVKPYNEITRAEFAKIICMLTGNGSMGDSLKSTASQFKDVAAGEWYTGWVNGAAAVGYFVGYTDGTFKPSNKVTDGEVITVLLRIAGYNDNLAGSWPYNYVVKGNSLGIVEEAINFSAAANSSRANVVLMANALLDKDVAMVAFSKDTESFVYQTDSKSNVLTVANNYKAIGNTDEYSINDWHLNTKGNLVLSAALTGGSTKNLEFAADYQVANGVSVYDLDGLKAKITLNKDDKIVFIEPLEKMIKSSNYKINSATTAERDTITIDGVRYTNAIKNNSGAVVAIVDTVSDMAKFKVNIKDNEIVAQPAEVEKNDGIITSGSNANGVYGVVKSINNGALIRESNVYGSGTFANASAMKNAEILVFVDGKLASFDDIKANYYVMQYNNAHGVDYVFYALSPGTIAISSISGDGVGNIVRFVANGVTYRNDNNDIKVSYNGEQFENFLLSDYNNKSLRNKDAAAIYANDGTIIALAYGQTADSGNSVTGIVTAATVYTEWDGGYTAKGYSNITVVDGSGTKKNYTIEDNGKDISLINPSGGSFTTLKMGTLVTLTLNDNDLVTNITSPSLAEKATPANVGDDASVSANTTRSTITVGSNSYSVTGNTVIFAVSKKAGSDDIDTVEIKTFSSVVSSSAIKATESIDVVADSSNNVKYLVVRGEATSTNVYGSLYSLYGGSDGKQIELVGSATTYAKAANMTGTANMYDLVQLTMVGGKVSTVTVRYTEAQVVSDKKELETRNNNVIGVDNKTYTYDSNTKVYLYEMKNGVVDTVELVSIDDLSVGDEIVVVPGTGTSSTYAQAIAIVR